MFEMKECVATGACTGSLVAKAFQLGGALSPPITVSGEPTYPSEERKILLRRTVVPPLTEL